MASTPVTPTGQNKRLSVNSGKAKSVNLSIDTPKENHSNNADTISVVCRFRPVKANEAPNTRQVFAIDSSSKSVEIFIDMHDQKAFAFDKILGSDAQQGDVFEQVAHVVDSVMSGFNGTVLAYGQTSAGKSWTMEGPRIDDPEARGVIPRSVERLFDAIANSGSHMQFQVKAAYYEIYCEKIRDLLNPAQDNLKLRETKHDGFVIPDVTEYVCMEKEDVLNAIQLGKANRISAPTLMNAESSRSHSILSLTVTQKDDVSGRSKRSKLFLVDLAGSEKVSKTGASGVRLEEAKNINSSLTTLGMVINALCDGSSHVPYRDSKLTRILMESLGGNSKTTMIICCAPEARHIPETVSTLRFGERAKHIKNHAKVNEELSVAELQHLLANARKEIALLKKQIALLKANPNANISELERESPSVVTALKPTISQTSDDDDAVSELVPTTPLALEMETARSELDDKSQHEGDKPDDALAAQSSRELETQLAALQVRLEDEVCLAIGYKSRIMELEEMIEVHQQSALAEKSANASLEKELSVLRDSVKELEERLVKATIENRKSHSLSIAAEEGGDRSTPLRRSSKVSVEVSPMPAPPNLDLLLPEPVLIPLPAPLPAPAPAPIAMSYTTVDAALKLGQQDSILPSATKAADLGAAAPQQASLGSPAGTPGEAVNAGTTSSCSKVDARDSGREPSGAAIAGLKDQSQELRYLLEQEIKTLENIITTREIETMNAQATASSYAAKYSKLREEYESYIQRLMSKLTQEQQQRTHAEDRLEEANQRIWALQNAPPERTESTSRKGLFGFFGGGSSSGSSSRRMSISGPPPAALMSPPPSALSNRELNLSRALELAQSKASQLAAELNANKEAHAIVLETKESVMRSLLKQNSQLAQEAEASAQKIEDLTATVDQLTRLLRSVQQQYANNISSANRATNSTDNAFRRGGTIQGGGTKGSPDSRK